MDMFYKMANAFKPKLIVIMVIFGIHAAINVINAMLIVKHVQVNTHVHHVIQDIL